MIGIGSADPEFTTLSRAVAEMNREADLMLAESQQLLDAPLQAPPLLQADLSKLPSGAKGYSVVSTLTPKGVCSRSVEYRSSADGRPQVVTRASGECGDGPAWRRGPSSRSDAPGLTSVAYQPAS